MEKFKPKNLEDLNQWRLDAIWGLCGEDEEYRRHALIKIRKLYNEMLVELPDEENKMSEKNNDTSIEIAPADLYRFDPESPSGLNLEMGKFYDHERFKKGEYRRYFYEVDGEHTGYFFMFIHYDEKGRRCTTFLSDRELVGIKEHREPYNDNWNDYMLICNEHSIKRLASFTGKLPICGCYERIHVNVTAKEISEGSADE